MYSTVLCGTFSRFHLQKYSNTYILQVKSNRMILKYDIPVCTVIKILFLFLLYHLLIFLFQFSLLLLSYLPSFLFLTIFFLSFCVSFFLRFFLSFFLSFSISFHLWLICSDFMQYYNLHKWCATLKWS